MNYTVSRRKMLGLLAAGAALPYSPPLLPAIKRNYRIRTVTAGVLMPGVGEIGALERVGTFLDGCRKRFEDADYQVQTLRLATQPLMDYLDDWSGSASMDAIRQMDDFCRERGLMLSLGPVNHRGQDSGEFVSWLVELITRTTNTSCSLAVAAPGLLQGADLPYIGYPGDVFLGQVMDRALLPRIGPGWRLRRCAETALTLAAHEYARRGIGVAWLPGSMARDDLASGRLVRLAEDVPSLDMEIWMIRLPRADGGGWDDDWRRLADTLSLAPPPAL